MASKARSKLVAIALLAAVLIAHASVISKIDTRKLIEKPNTRRSRLGFVNRLISHQQNALGKKRSRSKIRLSSIAVDLQNGKRFVTPPPKQDGCSGCKFATGYCPLECQPEERFIQPNFTQGHNKCNDCGQKDQKKCPSDCKKEKPGIWV